MWQLGIPTANQLYTNWQYLKVGNTNGISTGNSKRWVITTGNTKKQMCKIQVQIQNPGTNAKYKIQTKIQCSKQHERSPCNLQKTITTRNQEQKLYLILACLWKKLEEKATGLKEILSQIRLNTCLQLMIRLMQPTVNPHSLVNELPIQSFASGQSGQAWWLSHIFDYW